MSLSGNQDQLHVRYPMGPKIRSWLEISDLDYKGDSNSNPTPAELDAFQSKLMLHMEDFDVKHGDHLADLLEELVGMNLPLLAIKLVDSYPTQFLSDDFRSQLHLGNACLITGELDRAELCFRAAQAIVPEEPAPYVNLVQIYCEDGHLDTALTWCLTGLSCDPNFLRLWELLAWIYQKQDFATARAKIESEAKSRNSWAGVSLAVDLKNDAEGTDEPDARAKMIALEPFYSEGLRDLDFLVEYTAALGMAGHYERIPTILFQTESQKAPKDIPWQLYLHTIQAYLGLSRDDQALSLIQKVQDFDGVPPNARALLESLKSELSNERAPELH